MSDLINALKEEFKKSNEHFKSEISVLSVGRATPLLVEDIMVDYYGAPTPLKQVAAINVSDSRNILIQPWDKKQLKDIEKAINLAQLGFNPVNDGEKIRITVPQPTEERRKELVKHLHAIYEKARISARNARENAIKEIKKMEKDSLISEDERFRKQEEVQKIMNEFGKIMEEENKKKEKEIMTV